LPGTTANGSNGPLRAGASTLLLLADPTNVRILHEISKSGPTSPFDISGEPEDAGLYDLTEAGQEQVVTASVLEEWLARAPGGPILLDSPDWEGATRALVDAWSTAVIHLVAMRPRSLEELQREVEGLSGPALERLLIAMHGYGLLDEVENDYDEARYVPTRWLREAIAPLSVACGAERRHMAETATLTNAFDSIAMFQLALPLIRIPSRYSGSCRLSVALTSEAGLEPIDVIVDVQDGRVEVRSTRLEVDTDAWISGDREAWAAAAIRDETSGVLIGGDEELARAVLGGFHETIFAGIL
jgi:DNA-binding HxlR family transcriptional regulator